MYQENLKTGWALNITTNKHSVKRPVTQKNNYQFWSVIWSGKEFAWNAREGLYCRRCVFNPRVWKDPLEKETATHSSILAWRIPQTEETGGLQSMGLQRVRHDWAHTHSHEIKYTLTIQSSNSTLMYLTKRNGIMCPRKTCECSQRLYSSQPRTENNPNSHQLMSGAF